MQEANDNNNNKKALREHTCSFKKKKPRGLALFPKIKLLLARWAAK